MADIGWIAGIIVAVLGALGITFGVSRHRISRLERQNRELSNEVANAMGRADRAEDRAEMADAASELNSRIASTVIRVGDDVEYGDGEELSDEDKRTARDIMSRD